MVVLMRNIIIAMGSVTEAIEQTIDYYNNRGEKYGLVKVRLYGHSQYSIS